MVLRSATQRISPAYESARRATLIRWLRAGAVGLTAMLLMAVRPT
ncbi:hypothetical protein [Mycolicibacterium vanbaalenii]|nr:hypothetical protein [Mycolicibacterium vanbaalenii]